MSLDIEFTANCGSSSLKARITTPMPTTHAESGEAVTQFVTNAIDEVANMATNLAEIAAPATLPLQATNGKADAEDRLQVSISHSMVNMLMLDIYDSSGTTRAIFALRNAKVSEVVGRILKLTYGPPHLALVNYCGETLDLDNTLAAVSPSTAIVGVSKLTYDQCGVEDGEALWMKVKKSERTWSGVVAER